MNRYVDIMNRIRQHAHPEWLTPSQKEAYDKICSRLGFLDEVNLWGDHGSGKTFLAWVLRARGLADYTARAGKMTQKLSLQRTIIVDNISWRRLEARDAVHQCRMLGYEKVILVSTEPVEDDIAHVSLSLSSEDIEKVRQNLRTIGVLPFTEEHQSLWDLVSPLTLRG